MTIGVFVQAVIFAIILLRIDWNEPVKEVQEDIVMEENLVKDEEKQGLLYSNSFDE